MHETPKTSPNSHKTYSSALSCPNAPTTLTAVVHPVHPRVRVYAALSERTAAGIFVHHSVPTGCLACWRCQTC